VSAATSVPREQLPPPFGRTLLIRRFEEDVEERFRAGDLASFLHACIGQEALARKRLRSASAALEEIAFLRTVRTDMCWRTGLRRTR
jgi:TPP-dependent pyruvate/acetoin dehydrogenase alpha subunit